jgi:polyhydroxyalkanoate synthesis regulator protein
MTREAVDFQVLDAKTGKDITHQILTQIIMEEESHGEQMLPISFLRQLDRDVRQLDAGNDAALSRSVDGQLPRQPAQAAETWQASMGPDALAKLAETNMAIFKAATAAFTPGAKPSEPAPNRPSGDDLDALKQQMAAMQKKLDELSK